MIKLSASYKVFVLLDFSLSMRSFPCFGSLDKSVFSKCGWGRGIPFGIFSSLSTKDQLSTENLAIWLGFQ